MGLNYQPQLVIAGSLPSTVVVMFGIEFYTAELMLNQDRTEDLDDFQPRWTVMFFLPSKTKMTGSKNQP